MFRTFIWCCYLTETNWAHRGDIVRYHQWPVKTGKRYRFRGSKPVRSGPVSGLGSVSGPVRSRIGLGTAAKKKIGFKKRNVQNRPKRVSTKLHGCTTYFRGVNGRLKFRIFENAKLWAAVYPPKSSRTAVKLCMGPFWTIWHISFFDLNKKNRGRGENLSASRRRVACLCANTRFW